jgi:hypothetical protein
LQNANTERSGNCHRTHGESFGPSRPAMIRTIFIVSAIASVAVAAVTVHRVAEYREWSRLDAISRAV